jgi:hypothetical protein
MTGLNETLPKKQLIDRFGSDVIFEEYGKSDLATLVKKIRQGIHGVAASVWNRIVNRGWHPVNPRQFAPYFETKNPDLYLAISELLGVAVIRDIYYVKGWKAPKRRTNLIVEMLVAWVYRSDLQLWDITFINPERPIPKRARKFPLQTHEGLGLLPVLLENLQRKAKELGCEQLTLVAALRDQVRLFGRYGFAVEDSDMGRIRMKLGCSIPMERDV